VLTSLIDKKVSGIFPDSNINKLCEPPLVQPGMHGVFGVSNTPIIPINNPPLQKNQGFVNS